MQFEGNQNREDAQSCHVENARGMRGHLTPRGGTGFRLALPRLPQDLCISCVPSSPDLLPN